MIATRCHNGLHSRVQFLITRVPPGSKVFVSLWTCRGWTEKRAAILINLRASIGCREAKISPNTEREHRQTHHQQRLTWSDWAR